MPILLFVPKHLVPYKMSHKIIADLAHKKILSDQRESA